MQSEAVKTSLSTHFHRSFARAGIHAWIDQVLHFRENSRSLMDSVHKFKSSCPTFVELVQTRTEGYLAAAEKDSHVAWVVQSLVRKFSCMKNLGSDA